MYSVRPLKTTRYRQYEPFCYPIRAALEYRMIGHDRFLKTGTGWTTLFSSRSVLIESEAGLPLDKRVGLWIEWPVRLENEIGLRLHIEGRTVNAAGTATEVEILGYEFRTCARPPQRINEARNVGSSLKLPQPVLRRVPPGSPRPTRPINRA